MEAIAINTEVEMYGLKYEIDGEENTESLKDFDDLLGLLEELKAYSSDSDIEILEAWVNGKEDEEYLVTYIETDFDDEEESEEIEDTFSSLKNAIEIYLQEESSTIQVLC